MDYRWYVSADEENFAANLKSMRETVGLTQSALAAEMGRWGFRWHQATVYKVESGERQIQLGEARAIAGVFGVPLDDMLKPPVEGRIERQLDYDVNRFRHAHDRIAMQVVGFAEAHRALTQSVETAMSIADGNAEIQSKIETAQTLLEITAESAFRTGTRAAADPRVVDERMPRSWFRAQYGLVKDYPQPSIAEGLADAPEA